MFYTQIETIVNVTWNNRYAFNLVKTLCNDAIIV